MSDHAGSERPTRVPKPRPAPLLPPERSASSSAKVRVNDRQTAAEQVGAYGTFDSNSKGRRSSNSESPSKRLTFLEYMSSPHSPLVQVRSHCQQQWMAILLTIVLLGVTLYFLLGTSTPPIGASCATPFGTYLGENNGVVAYSNCNRRFYGNNMEHYVRIGLQRVSTGTKWQSIEYVRRYWILTRQLVLPAVPASDKLLDLEEVRLTSKTLRDATVPLLRFRNLPKPLAEVVPSSPEGQPPSSSGGAGTTRTTSALLDPTAADSARKGQGTGGGGADGGRVNPNGVPLAEWVVDRQAALVREGDIIAYAVQKPNLSHGHAAVVVHVSGPFRRIEEMSPRMQSFLSKTDENGSALLDSPAEDEHARTLPLGKLREEQRDLARPSASATSNKFGAQVGSLLYEVFIAEQNVDNWYWADPLTEKDADDLEKRSSKDTNETSLFTSAFKVGVPHPSAPGSDKKNNTHDDDADALFVRRTFSRVLLLREYYPSQTYYLEDSLHNRIVGWIRPTENRA